MGETLGNYQLTRHLATGGMAEIWIAKQSGAGGFARDIAIKRILPHLAREKRFVDMFLDEARIASALRHPNIVQIYDLGEHDGEYFIAMEYIEGADLADLLDEAEERNVEFPIAISVRIIADVLAALDFAHEFKMEDRPLKIVHRDVSPHNVLIGTDGMIKLVDFGIAHAVERHAKTETGLVKGKLSYMAPEQVEQGAVDRRADVFAAGVLLYELLTLQTPFGRELAAVSAILHDDPKDPRAYRPEIPDELVPIIFKSLEKRPDDRYQSAQEMLEALEGVLRSFDKYVSAKHVARFAERLLAGDPIEGYDDVSQALPRSVGRRAMVEATTQVTTPAGIDSLEDTVAEGSPGAKRISTDEISAPAESARRPVRRREDLSEEEVVPRRVPRWVVPLLSGLTLMVVVGVVVGALGTSDEALSTTSNPPIEATDSAEDVVDLRLDPVVVDEVDPPSEPVSGGGEGFAFDEEDVALVALEEAVATLKPEEVERMLMAHYERSVEDYLWSVRGPHLLGEFTDPPEAIDPGDPLAPELLGLDLSAAAPPEPIKPKKRVKVRRKPRPRPAARKTTSPPVTKPKEPTAEAKQPQKKPAQTRKTTRKAPQPKKSKRSKNDLRIIDKAVPY